MAKQIDIEIGSLLWKSWRRTHITATDSAKLCGKSRFGDIHEVWAEKIENKEIEDNWYMQRGRELEPLAREHLSKRFEVDLKDALYESVEYPFMCASIDAISDDGKIAFEIKTCSSDKIAELKEYETIEEGYIYQVQKQMLVLGLDKIGIYFLDRDKEDVDFDKDSYYKIIKRDEKIIKEIIEADKAFWEMLVNETPPKPKDIELEFDEEEELFTLQNDVKEKLTRIEALKKIIRDKAKETGSNVRGKHFYIFQGTRIATDWKAVCKKWEISNEELKEFTNSSTTYTVKAIAKK